MDEGLDIRFYLELLRRRFLVMAAVFCAVLAGAVAVAILLPPVFRSEAKIVVESQQIPEELVRSTTTSFADERIQVIRQIVTAREGIVTIANKFGLFAARRPNLSTTELVDLVRNRIFIDPLALGNTRARTAPTAFAFTVGFEYDNPEIAGRVANELVTLILNENMRTKIAQATETTKFLEREVARRRADLVVAEAKITEYRQQNRDTLPENLQLLARQLERASSERGEAVRQLQLLEEQERMLKFELGVRSAPSENGMISQNTAAISKQLDMLRAELTQKSAIYSSEHPDIKALRRQIDALANQLAKIPTPVASTSSTTSPTDPSKLSLDARLVAEKIAVVESHRSSLEAQRTAIDAKIDSMNNLLARGPEVQNSLNDLLQQRESMKTGLAELEGKLAAARLGEKLEEDQQGQRFQVIEQPITPQVPIRPNRPLLILAGTGGAFAASGALVFLLELLNRSIRRSADLVKYLNVQPLVTIPYIVSRKETRRKRWRWLFIVLVLLFVVAAALAAVHMFYMPLDIAWFKVLRRFQLR